MSEDDRRRFTDREVALILKKASELDEQRDSSAATGLSRGDLEDIAREAGISVGSIGQAIAEMGSRQKGKALFRGPLVHRTVRAVEGELDRETLKRLIHLVDERVSTPGTVAEALDSVRWTGRDRFRSTQVAITPQSGETSIQVTEKATGRLARITHLIPGAVGLMLGTSVLGSLGLSPTAEVIGIVGAVGSGLAAGRLVWNWLSWKSAERVQQLAEALSREAEEASEAGRELPRESPL
ncbi:MAG TPA: hypothetical protein VE173_15425 [Longimicrobiales bacterium]|nr:hypothetical protein [Longimicrobiales bacterium]